MSIAPRPSLETVGVVRLCDGSLTADPRPPGAPVPVPFWSGPRLLMSSALAWLGGVVGGTERRLRRVDEDPSLARPHDVEALLRAHGTRESGIRIAIEQAAAMGLDPRRMWTWIVEHDGSALVEFLAGAHAYEIVERFTGPISEHRSEPWSPVAGAGDRAAGP